MAEGLIEEDQSTLHRILDLWNVGIRVKLHGPENKQLTAELAPLINNWVRGSVRTHVLRLNSSTLSPFRPTANCNTNTN